MYPASISNEIKSWVPFSAPPKIKEWKCAGIKFFNYVQEQSMNPMKFSSRLQTAVVSWRQAFGYPPVLVPIETAANLFEEISRLDKTEVVAKTMHLVATHFPANEKTTLSETQIQFIHERLVPLEIYFLRNGEKLINQQAFCNWIAIGLKQRITPAVCDQLQMAITLEFEQVLMLRREAFHKAAHSFSAWCQLIKREYGLGVLADKLQALLLKINQPDSVSDSDIEIIYNLQIPVWEGLMASDIARMKRIVLEGVKIKIETIKQQKEFLNAS